MKTQIKLLTAALALATASAHAGVVLNTHNDGTAEAKTLIGSGASGNGVAVGTQAIADNSKGGGLLISTAIGYQAQAVYQGSSALGAWTHSANLDSTAVGVVSEAYGNRSTALGTYATTLNGANHSTAIGYRSSVAAEDLKDGRSAYTNEEIKTTHGVVSMGQSVAANTALQATDTISTINQSRHHRFVRDDATGHTTVNRRIINVAGGMEDNDAANVGQLKALETKVNEYTDRKIATVNTTITDLDGRVTALETGGAGSARVNQRLDNLENRVDTVERRANDGVALAIATASMAPPVYGKNHTVSVGTGFYRGSNALAIGYVYTNNNNWSLKTTVSGAGRGNFGGGVGTSFSW